MPACLDCGGDLLLGAERPDLDEIVICPECGAELAVVTVAPLVFRLIAEEDSAEDEPVS